MFVHHKPGDVSGGNLSEDETGGKTKSHFLNISLHLTLLTILAISFGVTECSIQLV